MVCLVICALRNCRLKLLSLPLSYDLAEGDEEFIHILAGVVEGEGGTDTHFVAEGSEGGLGAVVTGTHCDALLI